MYKIELQQLIFLIMQVNLLPYSVDKTIKSNKFLKTIVLTLVVVFYSKNTLLFIKYIIVYNSFYREFCLVIRIMC